MLSLRTSPQTGVAIRISSPGTIVRNSRGGHRPPEVPLADQGELSRASPASTRLRGSELAHFDNPSVMALRETAMPAPFTQGSLGCSCTSAFFDSAGSDLIRPSGTYTLLCNCHWQLFNLNSLRGAPPSQGKALVHALPDGHRANFFQIPIDKVGYRCYTANTYQKGE